MAEGERLFEVKFEIDLNSEEQTAEKLGLEFLKEYSDTDNYLKSPKDKVLKLKLVDNTIILYEVFFDGECFNISGRNISKEEKDLLLQDNPLETRINRKKRVYLFKEFDVKIDFDRMEQLPNRLFLEIHSVVKGDVLRAMRYVEEQLSLKSTIKVSYDELLHSLPGERGLSA